MRSQHVRKVSSGQVPVGWGEGPALGFTLGGGHRHSGQRPSRSAVNFPSRGRARWVGGRRWRLSRRRQSSKGVSFYFPFVSFFGERTLLFSLRVWFLVFSSLLGMLVAKWEPTPCYRDGYSVGTPNWALREIGLAKALQDHVFHPFLDVSF